MTGVASQGAQPKGGGPAEVMESIASLASIPGRQYSPHHPCVDSAIAVWGPLIARHLRRRRYGTTWEPDTLALTVDDIVRSIVRMVYMNRGNSRRMKLKYPFEDPDVTGWIERLTSQLIGQGTEDSDVAQAHSSVKALLRTFRVSCPKHFMLMKKGLSCPEQVWNLKWLAPTVHNDLADLLYEEHRISDFIHEQRHLRKAEFPHRSATAQMDREVSACTLWYIYLIFGRLRFGQLTRLHAPSPKIPDVGQDSSTVLVAIAERFSSLFWMTKEFAGQGRQYVAAHHREMYEALQLTRDNSKRSK